jgi:hypothetical protein
MILPTRSFRSRALLLLVSLSTGACARRSAPPAPAPTPVTASGDITSAADVVRAMHDRYATAWYRTLTFHQTTTITLPSGQLVQTWYEAGKFPGRLRIDTDSVGSSGVIYARDSVFQFAGGRLARADTGQNDLMILGFDVYAQPLDTSLDVLKKRGFDLTRFHRGVWQGKAVYVIGAKAGDTLSKQFWVEEDRLLFVRLLESRRTASGSGSRLEDIRFGNYVKYDGGWVAEDVMMYQDGKPRLHETYADVRVNVPLSDAVFDPRQWNTAPRWYKR